MLTLKKEKISLHKSGGPGGAAPWSKNFTHLGRAAGKQREGKERRSKSKVWAKPLMANFVPCFKGVKACSPNLS